MELTSVDSATIMIIDDQEGSIRLLEKTLQLDGFYAITSIRDPRDAIATIAQVQPDIILLDLHMPYLNGFTILEYMLSLQDQIAPIPIIVLTADNMIHVRWRALSCGAKDFLTKPFDTREVLLRVRNLLTTRLLQLRLHQHNLQLEQQIADRTRSLEQAKQELLERLARTGEYCDDDTGRHAQRVGTLARQIAHQLGLTKEEALLIEQAAPLHDLGKIGIPDHILLKTEALTSQEFTIVKQHPAIGATLLANSQFSVLQVAAEIAYSHHEHWDGSGYPRRLKGEAIPLAGRIVAVADTFDMLTHARPHHSALTVEGSVIELQRMTGKQFDPAVVHACIEVLIAEYGLDSRVDGWCGGGSV